MAGFVIFSQQRSGTGALASFIVSHPQVQDVSEILNPYDIDREDNFFRFLVQSDLKSLLLDHVSPSQTFESYIDSLEKKYAGQHILLDIKLNSIRHVLNFWEELSGFSEVNMPWLIKFLQLNNYHAIYLHRENHLHRFMSSKLAETTGVYRTSDRRYVGQTKINLDLGQMVEFIMTSEANHERFLPMLRKFDRHLYLNYDQTFVGSAIRPEIKVEIARLFGFPLLVDQEPYYVKMGSTKLDKVVANLHEVTVELERIGRVHYLES